MTFNLNQINSFDILHTLAMNNIEFDAEGVINIFTTVKLVSANSKVPFERFKLYQS